MQTFDFGFVIGLIPILLKYLVVTLKMSFLALLLGLVVAIIIALVVDAKIPVLSKLSNVYISFFRGTPLVAQMFFIYFGLIQIIPGLKELEAFDAVVIVLGLN